MLSHQDGGWCQVLGLGTADEPVLRDDTRPCIGQGWTNAAQQALSSVPATRKITHVFSDLNGEPYRADQFGFACMRTSDRLRDGWERYTPALASGDVGAATALVHVALSANLLRQHAADADAQTHLLLASSDDSLRSAVVLGR